MGVWQISFLVMEYQETQSISHKIWPLNLDSEEKASNNILTEVWYVNFRILEMVVDGGHI